MFLFERIKDGEMTLASCFRTSNVDDSSYACFKICDSTLISSPRKIF